MSRFVVSFKMWVVDVVLVPSGTVLYAQEALFMPISAMGEQLIVIVERYVAEVARRMASESSSLIIVCTGRLRIAFLYMLFQLIWTEQSMLMCCSKATQSVEWASLEAQTNGSLLKIFLFLVHKSQKTRPCTALTCFFRSAQPVPR